MEFIAHHKRGKGKGWTWSALGDDGGLVYTSDMAVEAEHGAPTKLRAIEVAVKTAKSIYAATIEPADVKVIDGPLVLAEDSPERAAEKAATRTAAAAKAAATKAERKAEKDAAQAEAQRVIDTLAQAKADAVAKAATKGFDPAKHYSVDRKCSVCQAYVERTGRRGKPPATCEKHRGQTVTAKGEVKAREPKAETPRPFGPDCYPKPCACCGKGIKRTGERGRPPVYCSKVKCQKAKAAAKVKVAA